MTFLRPTDAIAARAVNRAGVLCGIFLIARSIVRGCVHGQDIAKDLLWASIFGAVAVVLLALVGRLANAFLLGRRLPSAGEGGNLAAAIASSAHYIAGGSIIGHCIYGDDLNTLWLSFVLLLIAVVTLLVLLTLFRTLTTYDDNAEIAGGNPAAALSYAGVTVAMATIVGHAADRSFVESAISLRSYLVALLFCLALYPVRQILVGRFILGLPLARRGGALDALIAPDRNMGAAAAEALAYVATAMLVSGVV